MFHERYHLERSEDLKDERDNLGFNNNPDDDDGDEEVPDVMNVVDDGLAIKENVLTSNQKHNIVFPEMLKISNLVACHGTKKFLEYVEAFRKIEKIVRKGGKIFNIENSQDEGSDETDHDTPSSQADLSEVVIHNDRRPIMIQL